MVFHQHPRMHEHVAKPVLIYEKRLVKSQSEVMLADKLPFENFIDKFKVKNGCEFVSATLGKIHFCKKKKEKRKITWLPFGALMLFYLLLRLIIFTFSQIVYLQCTFFLAGGMGGSSFKACSSSSTCKFRNRGNLLSNFLSFP